MTGQYSDIKSDGGMDPRNKLDDSMYRLTVAQRDAAWREVEYWRERHDALLKLLADQASARPTQPVVLGDKASYEAGHAAGVREERNRVWTQDHWTEYEHGIAVRERHECARLANVALLGADINLRNRVVKAIYREGKT